MTSETIVRFLRTEVSLFEGFDEERLLELVSGSRVTTFEEHEAVVEFGEEGRFLGILLEGSAEISVVDDRRAHRRGRHRVDALHGPSDPPGTFFEHAHHPSSCTQTSLPAHLQEGR